MKVVKNIFIPFPGFVAINLFGVLFVRKEHAWRLKPNVYNHEAIHTEQMKEMFWIFFYLWYLAEWLIRVLFTKDFFSKQAYYHISFEREALTNENDMDYIANRKHYAWLKQQ